MIFTIREFKFKRLKNARWRAIYKGQIYFIGVKCCNRLAKKLLNLSNWFDVRVIKELDK